MLKNALLAVLVAGSMTATAMAGAIGGPIEHLDVLQPGETLVGEICFEGGELALVAVVGEDYSDLDVDIYDEFGNLVGWDSECEECEVIWLPKEGSCYVIEITNFDDFATLVGLGTN